LVVKIQQRGKVGFAGLIFRSLIHILTDRLSRVTRGLTP
jgi:hypothetical protein